MNIKDFIYSKKDEGIYRKRTIFGIKIITKPYELILNDKLDRILHDYDNLIWGGGVNKIEILRRENELMFYNKNCHYDKPLICASQLCNQEFFGLPLYQYWCNKILEKPHFHRKQWEFIYIIQTLYENGCLEEGKKGLVFGVGKEPLPALFASMGCKILATDLDCNIEQSKSWIEANQHVQNDINKLNERNICPDKIFNENVSFMPLDMNEIPDTLKDFDFNWSSCALEHIGGLENSINFIINNLKTLKSGGIAVHTTEYNLSSNEDTFLNPYNIIFRKKDILEVVKRLEDLGHYVYPLDFRQGNYMLDNYVDTPPYSSDFHLRLQIDKYVATSIGLIVRKK